MGERSVLDSYQRLNVLYESLPQSDTNKDRKVRTLADQSQLTITQINSAAQNAFIVGMGKSIFYVSSEGIEWISLPGLIVDVAGVQLKIPVNPFTNFPHEQSATTSLVKWVEDCIQNDHLIPSPFRVQFET